MDLTAALFAVGCILAFLAAFMTPYEPRGLWESSVISTGGLILYWGVNNTIYMVFPLWMYVVTDILFTVAYGYLFRINSLVFLGILLPLMASNVAFDLAYHLGLMPYSDMMRDENWIMAVMLVVSAYAGIWQVIKWIVKAAWWLFWKQVWLVTWPYVQLFRWLMRVVRRVQAPAPVPNTFLGTT